MNFFDRIFRRTPPPQTTGRVIARADVPTLCGTIVVTADEQYAEVNSAWLKAFYGDFRTVLFREGVHEWSQRFDCDDFASFFVSLANIRFFSAAWGSSSPEQSLALGECWYFRDGVRNGSHAVVTALTERGLIHIEPQTGQELTLTDAELKSRFFLKF